MHASEFDFRPSPRVMQRLAITAGIGGLCFLFGLFAAPVRAWGGFLMGFSYFTGLALAGGLFLTILCLTGAKWAVALRRIPEAMTTALPYGLVLGVLLMAGLSSLYEWSHEAVVSQDHILQGKSSYLNGWFFILRLVVFFILWIVITRGMVLASRRQDQDGDPAHSRRMLWGAVAFLPVFAITYSLASVDWLQSLEPHWFSTIYGLVTLSGVGTSGLAVCIILLVALRRSGHLRNIVRDDHLDDLGKIGIALALFWGYIWYCQYMLIWYTNMPEETPYYFLRSQGNWRVLGWINVTLNWAIPFFVLMPKAARRSEVVLVRVAVVMLLGQAMQHYMLVAPPLMGETAVVGLWEIGPVVGAVALFFWATLKGLSSAPLVPTRDPNLEPSLHHHC